MSTKVKVLVIEDEEAISNFIATALKANDYNVLVARSGNEALSLFLSHCPEIVLLDLGLPDLDGVEVLEKIREWSATPVIVVSARSDESDKVQALDLGADDYIPKPFGTSELLARIRAALRHRRNAGKQGAEDIFTVKDLKIDFGKRLITVGERDVHLTQIEFKIVSLLAKSPGRVLTYDSIITELWGPYAMKDNQILRVNMANIRRKLEKNPATPEYISTEVGVGYRMAEE